jgi:hypothetical protein
MGLVTCSSGSAWDDGNSVILYLYAFFVYVSSSRCEGSRNMDRRIHGGGRDFSGVSGLVSVARPMSLKWARK